MLISGIQKFTLLDYPNKISCIVFIPGCSFRCGYCHNPEFVLPELIQKIQHAFISEEAFFNFLRKRIGLLEGVVISGGEPTIMQDLPQFIGKIKNLGFLVKLDTNGNNPVMLRSLLQKSLLDYIAMDIKTSPDEYQKLVGGIAKKEQILESINLIMQSDVDYEFRGTLIKETHSPEILHEMGRLIKGSRVYYLQTFRSNHTLDPVFASYHPFSVQDMNEARDIFQLYVKEVYIRG